MGKISKKYIGDDQVGHIQLELENAGSLRAKSQDGLSSVDLLEYSVDDLLVVQQDLYIADLKNFYSQAALGGQFEIKTVDSALIRMYSGDVAGFEEQSGEIEVKSGNSAQYSSGNLTLSSGTASSAASGAVFLKSGNANSANSGAVEISSGQATGLSANSGDISILTGNAPNDSSGDILIKTSEVAGEGLRGDITLESFNLNIECIQDGAWAQGVVTVNALNFKLDNTPLEYYSPAASGSLFIQNDSMSPTTFQILAQSQLDVVATGHARFISGIDFDVTLETSSSLSPATNSGQVNIVSGSASDGNSGSITILTGTASGNSGPIYIETGTASSNRGDIYLTSRDVVINVPDSGEFKIFSDLGAGAWSKFMFTALGQASDAPAMILNEVGSVVAYLHQSIGQNDAAVGETYFQGALVKTTTGGSLTGGNINIQSGGGLAALINAANAEVDSGDVVIESIDAYVKGTGVDADSGSIFIQTGAKQGAGVRGSITLDALEVQCSAMQFKDAADPTDAQDLATKFYVDQQISAGTTCHKEEITLDATDISNQYVDLQEQMIPESLVIGVGARVNLYETLDYTVSVVGGVTRLTFAGPSATGGAEALVLDDKLYITGIVDISP